MEEIKKLWEHKREPQGRINITLFFSNVFLLLTHIFLMIIYIMIGHKVMIVVDSVSLIINLIFFFNCYKHSGVFVGLSFFEIWIHMIFGTIIFGWNIGFQNWSFAMVAAYFLPAFNKNQERRPYKQSIIYILLVLVSYFVLAFLVNLNEFKTVYPLDKWMTISIFISNNLMAFFTIIMFALFYTTYRDRKVKELTRKADYDELTGLYNRHALIEISESIIMDAKNMNIPYSVAILDIDHFKQINDTYGHTSGDEVLKGFASLIRSYSIKGITCGRWGGEEFVMIAPSNIKYSEFINILENLRKGVSKADFVVEGNKEIHITVSIGAEKIRNYSSLEDSVTMADTNLYQAKESGRNRVIG